MTQPSATAAEAPGTRGWREAAGPDPAYGHVPPGWQLPRRCSPSARFTHSRRHATTVGWYSQPSQDAERAPLGYSTHRPGVQHPQRRRAGMGGILCSGDMWVLASEADPRDPCHHCCPLLRPRKPSQQLEGTNSRMRVTGRFLPTRAQPDARTPSPATLHPRSAPPGPAAGPFIPSPPSWATSRLQRSGAAPGPAGMRWTAALTLPGRGRTCQPGWLHRDLSPEILSRKCPLQLGLAPRADPTKFQPFPATDQWEGAEMSPGCTHQPPAPVLQMAAPVLGGPSCRVPPRGDARSRPAWRRRAIASKTRPRTPGLLGPHMASPVPPSAGR